jgi:hypothetical protein
MIQKIRCYTLFNITKTGIINRKNSSKLGLDKDKEWEKLRNTQCNFDTLIQVISLRSQPENITDPIQEMVVFDDCDLFGFMYDKQECQCAWSFEFTVNFHGVYHDGINEFGYLYFDCDNVPMIKTEDSWDKLPSFLDTTPELRNIYFEVITNET